jgi:branched-chain amino acid transport system permease protein
MSDLLQLLISGTATGGTYALAALGFTLLWQASGTINFATGEFVMIPAFLMLFALAVGIPYWPAFLLAALASAAVLGFGFKRTMVDPLRQVGGHSLVIATMGLSIGLKQLIKAGYSAEAHPFPGLFADKLFDLGALRVSYGDVGTVAVALVIVGSLQLFLNKTLTGRAMQACAQNTEAATVLGIKVHRMILYTFVINAVLGAVAAVLVTPTYLAKFDMGDTIGMKAFFAAIIGGFNQTRGALLGGVLIGVLENVVGHFISPSYKESAVLFLFLIVILFRPEGLLGKAEERKV